MANVAKSSNCFLCGRTISHAPGTSVVEALEPDTRPRQFHLNCFVAFTTGSLHAGNIWAYRLIAVSVS